MVVSHGEEAGLTMLLVSFAEFIYCLLKAAGGLMAKSEGHADIP